MTKSGVSLKSLIAARLLPYRTRLARVNWTSKWCHTIQQVDCPRFQKREDMYAYLQHDILKDAPIDYLEFGVAGGESLRCWCALNRHSESRFFGFDSFTGLPEDWNALRPKGTFNQDGVPPDIADLRVQFHIGLFQESLPSFLNFYRPSNRVVIHNDSDLYSSTLYTLTMMERVISPDTIVMFDEFSDVLHEYRAFSDYTDAYRKSFKIIAVTSHFSQVAVRFQDHEAAARTGAASPVGTATL